MNNNNKILYVYFEENTFKAAKDLSINVSEICRQALAKEIQNTYLYGRNMYIVMPFKTIKKMVFRCDAKMRSDVKWLNLPVNYICNMALKEYIKKRSALVQSAI